MQRLRTMHLFAGAGGGLLADLLLGHQPVCAVEWDGYCQQVLSARQKDGLLPWFPIFGDVQQFDGKPWAGIVDVVSGGFPCQDISAAGKGAGIDGERSGMWREMARIIHEVRPKFVFVENSPMLTSRGLGTVLGDLTSMGFDARWGVLGAADVGANHQRDRIWIVGKMGNANNNGQVATEIGESIAQRSNTSKARSQQASQSTRSSKQYAELADTNIAQRKGMCVTKRIQQKYTYACSPNWWEIEPDVGRVADGLASGNDRLKAIGNGQVPLCAATAWRILSKDF